MSLRKHLSIVIALLAISSVIEAPPAALARSQSSSGRVEIAGRVTDSAGQPIEGLEVALNAVRRTFSFRRLRMENRDPMRLATETDAEGAYRLEWISDPSYNRFDLEVGFYLRKGQEERFELLQMADISLRIVDGGPVVVPVVIDDTVLLQDYRNFLASVRTVDETRVFEGSGRPDRISRTEDTDRSSVKWWYFDFGKVYSFEDGTLVEVSDFDPVEAFDGKDR